MNIEFEEDKTVVDNFNRIAVGECFKFRGGIYLKIKPIALKDSNLGTTLNAIHLQSSSPTAFEYNDVGPYTILKASLVIRK